MYAICFQSKCPILDEQLLEQGTLSLGSWIPLLFLPGRHSGILHMPSKPLQHAFSICTEAWKSEEKNTQHRGCMVNDIQDSSCYTVFYITLMSVNACGLYKEIVKACAQCFHMAQSYGGVMVVDLII